MTTDPFHGTTIATLGGLKAHGYKLHGFCPACGKNDYLDLDALIARHGEAHSYLKGSLTLRCSCGALADYHLHPPAPKLR